MEAYFEFRFIVEIIELVIGGLAILGCIIYYIYSYFKYHKEN